MLKLHSYYSWGQARASQDQLYFYVARQLLNNSVVEVWWNDSTSPGPGDTLRADIDEEWPCFEVTEAEYLLSKIT